MHGITVSPENEVTIPGNIVSALENNDTTGAVRLLKE
jgi:hypothetical protein